MIYALHNGARVVNVIDHKAAPLTHQQYLDALGLDSLMHEPTTLEEVEATYLYGLEGRGEQAFTDAIVTTRNRIERTMGGFVRALNQALTGTEIQAADPKIGDPRKAGDVAVLSAELPLSDGQSVFVIFHSPSNDPSKITAADMLVAFRFLLNKRDVTHVVAPNKGRDISLKQTTMALANLAERNSARFAAKQADNKAKAEELATLEADTEQQMKQAELLGEQLDTLASANGATNDELSKVNAQLTNQIQRNDELRKKLAMRQAVEPPPAPATEPTPAQATKPTPAQGDEAKVELVTQQNRPSTGEKLGILQVVNSTDRLIDVTPGTPGVAATRYTWDGAGFKRRGQYLLMNGGSIPMEQVTPDTTKQEQLPEDGLRYVKRQLRIYGKVTLTNGAELALNSYNKDGELEGFASITTPDGTTYRLDSPSPQGGAMEDTAGELYKAYRDGKAGKYRFEGTPEEPIAEQIKAALSVLMGSYGAGWRSEWDELDDQPVIALSTPALPGGEEHDGYYIKANLGADGKPVGTFQVLYGDGGPITGGAEVQAKAEAKEIVTRVYQKDYDEAFAKLTPNEPAQGGEGVSDVATETTPLYWYGMRVRPYGLSTQPDGVIAHIPEADVASDPRVADLIKERSPTGWRHGMIAYKEPLTKAQIDQYSLEDMSAAVWSAASRAARMAELDDVVSRMVELGETDDEIWNELFKPKGSLVESNNPFFVDGKYESTQLTQALQEAGYTGSVKAMTNSLIDKARAAATPPVTDGGEPPVDGGTELPAGDELAPTSNQWDEADPAILALLEQLEALRTDEGNYSAYLEKMGTLIEQLEQAGAVERHEPYLHKVADRLTELMEAAA